MTAMTLQNVLHKSCFGTFINPIVICFLVQETGQNLSKNLEASVFVLSHGQGNVLRTVHLVLAEVQHIGKQSAQPGH